MSRKPPKAIGKLEEAKGLRIKVSAICELFGMSRMQYQDCVRRGDIKRNELKSPLLIGSVQAYVAHLKKVEATAEANLKRINSQVAYTRSRQKNEELKTAEREGELIPLADSLRECRALGVLTRQFCDRVVVECVKRVPAKQRVKVRGELAQLTVEMLADYADGLDDETKNE